MGININVSRLLKLKQVSQSFYQYISGWTWAEQNSQTNLASVGSVFNDTRKVKVLSLPETIKENQRFERRPFVESWGSGKTTRVFIRVNTKTSRDKTKANQMDFIKTICKQRNVNRIAKYNTRQ